MSLRPRKQEEKEEIKVYYDNQGIFNRRRLYITASNRIESNYQRTSPTEGKISEMIELI